MKILKSKKALSPVVASIILIAVTVAVSIAVAAWMGSLTTGQMQTERITFTAYQWQTPGTQSYVSWIVIKVKNTGDTDLSLAEIRVDNIAVTTHNVTTIPYPLAKGNELSINITGTFTRGVQYQFSVLTSRGNSFGPYTLPAP